MQLDHTRLAIRERTLLELLDFGLRVVRAYFQPIATAAALPMAALMLLNWWLVGWIASDEYTPATIARYQWVMAQLVYVEAPFGTSLVTLLLGGSTFRHEQSVRQLLGTFAALFPRIVISQLLLRGVLLAWILAYWISPDEDFSAAEFLLPLLCTALLLLRSLRPYLNEIVLLERNPYRSGSKLVASIGGRSRALHAPNSGDLFARAVAIVPVSLLLTACLFTSIWFTIGTFTNDWSWTPLLVHLVLPACYWMVAIYLAVVRFLTYLDLRIRREGWEVELQMKAEAARL
jgi:hypothetical protein